MTLTKGGILAILRGLFEGIFGVLLLLAAGLSANMALILFIALLAYLILILLDQQDNVFEIIGIVIGAFLAIALGGTDAMPYVLALLILIVVRWLPAQTNRT